MKKEHSGKPEKNKKQVFSLNEYTACFEFFYANECMTSVDLVSSIVLYVIVVSWLPA